MLLSSYVMFTFTRFHLRSSPPSFVLRAWPLFTYVAVDDEASFISCVCICIPNGLFKGSKMGTRERSFTCDICKNTGSKSTSVCTAAAAEHSSYSTALNSSACCVQLGLLMADGQDGILLYFHLCNLDDKWNPEWHTSAMQINAPLAPRCWPFHGSSSMDRMIAPLLWDIFWPIWTFLICAQCNGMAPKHFSSLMSNEKNVWPKSMLRVCCGWPGIIKPPY